MSFELLNNGSHNNNIALFKYKKQTQPYFLKISLCIYANKILEKEYEGYKWFSENIKKGTCGVELIKKYYYELKIPKFEGRTFPFNTKLDKNIFYVEKLVNFYKDRWPNNEDFAIHGDLALNNIIFCGKDIYIVDWEHFHFSDMQNYGVDIINMLFILLRNQKNKDSSISNRTLQFLKKCYNTLITGNSRLNIVGHPFSYTREYIINNKNKYRENINIEDKFAIVAVDKRVLKNIDKRITIP